MKNITLFSYTVLLTSAHIVCAGGQPKKKRKSVTQMLDMLNSIYEQMGALVPTPSVVPPTSDRKN